MDPVQRPVAAAPSGGPAAAAEPLHLTSALLADAGFRHGFSTRRGGDDLGALAAAVGFAPDRAHQVSQVHGARVLEAAGSPDEQRREEADGLATRAPGVAVAVRTADCVPVLIGDPRSGAVAAVHAGWRGVVAGVLGEALRTLAAWGAHAGNLVVVIGPHIGPCCFEVSAEVGDAIAASARGGARAGDESAAVLARRAGDKAYVSLEAAVRAQLMESGITAARIERVAGCTRCDASRFFSYRREGKAAGRHVAIIVAGSQSG